jgi:hypothetical protein
MTGSFGAFWAAAILAQKLKLAVIGCPADSGPNGLDLRHALAVSATSRLRRAAKR